MAYHTADTLVNRKFVKFDDKWKAYRVDSKHSVAYKKERPLVEFLTFDIGGQVYHAYDADGDVVQGNIKPNALVFEVWKVV